jgi:hypothetical protein
MDQLNGRLGGIITTVSVSTTRINVMCTVVGILNI